MIYDRTKALMISRIIKKELENLSPLEMLQVVEDVFLSVTLWVDRNKVGHPELDQYHGLVAFDLSHISTSLIDLLEVVEGKRSSGKKYRNILSAPFFNKERHKEESPLETCRWYSETFSDVFHYDPDAPAPEKVGIL